MIGEVRESFRKSLESLPGVYGAMAFGSGLVKTHGVEDYDVVVIANKDFVIPRNFYEGLSSAVAQTYEEFQLPLDVLLMDRTISTSMFSTVGEMIRNHFNKYGKVLTGRDPRDIFTRSFYDLRTTSDLKTVQYEALHHLSWTFKDSRRFAAKLGTLANEPNFEKILAKEIGLDTFCSNAVIFKGEADEKFEALKLFPKSFPDFSKVRLKIEDAVKSADLDKKKDLFYQSLNLRERLLKDLYMEFRNI